MSAPERTPDRYDTIVVVGGVCYGSYYVRQLGRALAAKAITWSRLVVVDRDPDCQVARQRALRSTPDAELRVGEWREFFREYLGAADASKRDAIVPSPLMPHLMYQWVQERAAARAHGTGLETLPLDRVPEVPWASAAPDGTHYVSFATWNCPINCVEPRKCPHTRDERTWSMPVAIERAARAHGDAVGPFTFHCSHRVFGVGMIDVRDVLRADQEIGAAIDRGETPDVLIATASHCHGAINRLVVR